MTDSKILKIEHTGYLEASVESAFVFCIYRKCEIHEWEDYYDFEQMGEGILCENCINDWLRDFIVRGGG